MKIAVSQLVATPASLPMADFLQKAKDCGYDGVELCLRPQDDVPLNYRTSDAELAAFVQQARELKLDIPSITISPGKGNLLDSGSEAQDSIDRTLWGLECANKLGAGVALHTLGRFNADLYYEDAYNNAVANLKKIAISAAKLNVTLAVEFIWNGFLFSPLEMRRFLDEVGSPFVGFYFDPGNMAVFQFPQHWVRALGKRVRHVHLKDWQGNALNGKWTPLTEGAVNFPAVMRELRDAGYTGPLVSEVPESLAPWQDTAAAMRKIAKM
ncbi:MAG: sugar phosphate isomerase/epimerase [Lentisphaerae bacterium]|jgi:L-ribulose-5-phosphate 3-epimerase|nr:sugar phosphate isomerase/epimerase [Lentisphaerota bacterium]